MCSGLSTISLMCGVFSRTQTIPYRELSSSWKPKGKVPLLLTLLCISHSSKPYVTLINMHFFLFNFQSNPSYKLQNKLEKSDGCAAKSLYGKCINQSGWERKDEHGPFSRSGEANWTNTVTSAFFKSLDEENILRNVVWLFMNFRFFAEILNKAMLGNECLSPPEIHTMKP